MGPLFERTQLKYWNFSTLDYSLYTGLAVFLGLFAIDQLYLRSPLSFLIKLVINLMTFGFLWFYDAAQALFNKDEIKIFGVNIPFLSSLIGPTGIGAGMFLDIPAGMPVQYKEMSNNFLIYSLVLLVTGLFGGDSFLLGDSMSGFIRMFSCISIIGLPVAFAWFIYNMYIFIFKTDQLLDMNWQYFAAPKPPIEPPLCPGILQQLTVYAVETTAAFASSIPILRLIEPRIREVSEALKQAYGMAVAVTKTVTETAKTVASAAPQLTAAIEATSQISAEKLAEAVARQEKMSGGFGGDMSVIGTAGVAGAMSSILTNSFIVVVLFVVVSGLIVTIRRMFVPGKGVDGFSKNKQKTSATNVDDIPPEPVVTEKSV